MNDKLERWIDLLTKDGLNTKKIVLDEMIEELKKQNDKRDRKS